MSQTVNPKQSGPWIKLEVSGQPIDLDLAVGLLDGLSKGAVEHDPDNTGLGKLDVYMQAADRRAAERRLASASIVVSGWGPVPEEAWELQWRDTFTPVSFGNGWTIVPEWDTETEAATLLRIRPGMAFGTGHHATTWLLLEMLIHLDCAGARVLDLGTGSGILAIAAALQGAHSVLGVDHDETCLENFSYNLALNDIGDSVSWRAADANIWDDFSYDIIAANIHSAVIFPLLERFERSGSEGDLLITGLLITEEPHFLEICERHGLTIQNTKYENDWFAAHVRTNAGEK